ncbi:MAG TPA: hypothetical protein VLL98_04025 [Rickettsiales bacterium]|nr:hypothetical protein [Rickettsiales bacterium]
MEINYTTLDKFKCKKNLFYREHKHIDNTTSIVLTEIGLLEYFRIRKEEEPELTKNIEFAISYDNTFENNIIKKTKKFLNDKKQTREYLIIHTDSHTFFLAKEGKFIYGEREAESFLNQYFREDINNFFVNISYDSIQHDYNNCRIFAIQNCIELERYLQTNNFTLCKMCIDNSSEETGKINIPLPLIQHIQSISKIKKVTGENFEELDKYYIKPGVTYKDELKKHIYCNEKPINGTIADESFRIQNKLEELSQNIEKKAKITQNSELLSVTEKYEDNSNSQKEGITIVNTFQNKLLLKREIEKNNQL